jgi:hypothetical protein
VIPLVLASLAFLPHVTNPWYPPKPGTEPSTETLTVTPVMTLVTKEWTPLEPKVLDRKTYTRGIGNVLEQTVGGLVERNELVSVERP